MTLTATLVPPPATPDFRIYLQGLLVARCKRNPAYSIRSFARAIGTDHSTLSQFLRGKRRISGKLMRTWATQVGLGPVETEDFIHTNLSGASKGGALQSPPMRELSLDAFRLIADWYHYAILELVDTRDFRADARWIARSLGISVAEAHEAIERLMRLELLQTREDGSLKRRPGRVTTTGNGFTAAAFRQLQAQVLEKALRALEEIPPERRDQSSMTFAFDTARLPEAKAILRKFRRQFCDRLQQGTVGNSVYQLGLSFYPVSTVGAPERGEL